jgi:hypothetical protein
VNVKSNKDATWLDWSEWDAANGSSVCPTGSTAFFGVCITPSWQIVDKVWQGNHNNWNGCVTDRKKDHDALDTVPTSLDTKFVPRQAGNCPVEVLPLTSSWTTLHSKVDAMTPTGNTNVTIGLAWAWHSLSPSLPLTQGAAHAQDLDKVIILLTDGDNTENRWKDSKTVMDARTKLACDNIKKEKKPDGKTSAYKLYTIRVIDGNATLLQQCATNPSMYYDVQNATQLSGVFTQIAKELANLRLAK